MKSAPKMQQTLDRYVIRRVLGTGAMGSVYAAWDPKLCREVALKVVPRELAQNPKTRARFLREARAIAAVRHPNIIEIYDYSGNDSEHLYLVIEKLDGQDLYQLMQRLGSLPETVALAVAHELCLALAVAHAKGIVHRDLKPENVFITHSGRVVLTDFGIVKAITRTSAIEGFQEPTEIIGTPGFMAPEQMSAGSLSHGVDLFSLGAMLYNLTTGEMPFQGASPFEIFRAAAMGTYADPRSLNPQLSAGFARLIALCLRPAPKDRPASAEALRQEVRRAIAQGGHFDLRDELQAFVDNPGAQARAAQRRTVDQLAAQLKVALQDHDLAATERLRMHLALCAPRHPLVAQLMSLEPSEATIVDSLAPTPMGPPTVATGVHRRWRGVRQTWRHLPPWLRALGLGLVASSVAAGAGIGLYARQLAESPAPLNLAVIRPLPPERPHLNVRPRTAAELSQAQSASRPYPVAPAARPQRHGHHARRRLSAAAAAPTALAFPAASAASTTPGPSGPPDGGLSRLH